MVHKQPSDIAKYNNNESFQHDKIGKTTNNCEANTKTVIRVESNVPMKHFALQIVIYYAATNTKTSRISLSVIPVWLTATDDVFSG